MYGSEFDPETKCRESFVIAETVDLDKNETYAKERALIEEVKAQLTRGRKCQVFAVYTNKHDVIERLEYLFRKEGIRAAIIAGQRSYSQAGSLVPRAATPWN